MRLMFVLVVLAVACPGWAQTQLQGRAISPAEEFASNRPANAPTSMGGAEYRIGSDDLIDVTVFEDRDLGGTGRVSASGVVSLPLIGAVQALGKTTQEVEKAVEEILKLKYVNDPHVTVFVREYASQPVSIVGAVKVPSIYQIKGQKSLLDMLAMAQGLDQITAGKTIQVIRKDRDTENSHTITISAEDLFQNGKTELNIPIQAGDVINVLQAGSIFVVGEVARPGEFPLRQGRNVTAGQAIALGSGFTKEAKKAECKIIRVHSDGTKEEIPINIAKIYSDGSANDVTLMPNDILFVPSNKIKTGLMRALDSTISIVSGRLIYAGF